MKDLHITIIVSEGNYPNLQFLPDLLKSITITKDMQKIVFDYRNTLEKKCLRIFRSLF